MQAEHLKPVTILTRRYSLSALHALSSESLSFKENLELFGPCSRLHGHDYQIEVSVQGPPDRVSGMVLGRDRLDRIVEERLLTPLRGRNLSEHFAQTTGEALAVEFYRVLAPAFAAPLFLAAVKLHETPKNSFTRGSLL